MMDGKSYNKMVEATRLTLQGRLKEATNLIQRNTGLGTKLIRIPGLKPFREIFRGNNEPAETAVTEANAATVTPKPSMSRAEDHSDEGSNGRFGSSFLRSSTSLPRFDMLAPLPCPGGATLPTRPIRHPGRPLPSPAPAEGQWIAASYSNGAGDRDYQLYIPSGYHGQAMPLVVMLHGCTQDPEDFAVGTRMNSLAEENGFFVAYPAQTAGANMSKCWNWFETAHQERDQGEPSIIAGITRQVMAKYQIDARRVYVAGLSAGGALAAIMAVTYPDLYAAVGVHSGLAAGAAHDLPSALKAMRKGGHSGQIIGSHTVPLILFHGDRDKTVHPANASDLLRQWGTGQSVVADRPALSVTKSQGRGADGRAYSCDIYRDTRGQVVAEQWILHGAGHSWSGGNDDGSFTDRVGPNASREMVRFFQHHPRQRNASPSGD